MCPWPFLWNLLHIVLSFSWLLEKDEQDNGLHLTIGHLQDMFMVTNDLSNPCWKGRDVSYDAPVVKAHQFPQHFEFNAVG